MWTVSAALHFFAGLLFFWGFFCFLSRTLKCPKSFAPLAAISTIICFLMFGGMLHILVPCTVLVFLAGAAGLLQELFFLKKNKVKDLLHYPVSWYVFFFLLIIFYVFSFQEFLSGNDPLHHWGVVQKGIVDYHAIFDLPTLFRNYPVGMGVWGYFINLLFFGRKFQQDAFIFSFLLTYVGAFSVLWVSCRDKAFVLRNILCSFIFIFFTSVWVLKSNAFIGWSAAILIVGLLSKYNGKKGTGIEEALKTIFLVLGVAYCGCSSVPHMCYGLVDLIMPFCAGAALFFYLSNPKLKTVLWLAPVLASLFCIKRAGLFLAVFVATICFLECYFSHRLYRCLPLHSLKKHKKRILWYLGGLAVVCFAVFLQTGMWKWHTERCNYSSGFKPTSYGSQRIRAVLAADAPQRVQEIRSNFIKTMKGLPILSRESSPNYSLLARYTNDKPDNKAMCGWSLQQAAFASILAIAAFIILLVLYRQYKQAMRISLLSIGMLFFCALYCFGLFYTYVYSFSPYEAKNCAGFQRYVMHVFCIWEFYLLYVFSQINISRNGKHNVFYRFIFVLLALLLWDSLRHACKDRLMKPQKGPQFHQTAAKMIQKWPSGKPFDQKKIIIFWCENPTPPIASINMEGCLNMQSPYGNAAQIFICYPHIKIPNFKIEQFDYVWWYVSENFDPAMMQKIPQSILSQPYAQDPLRSHLYERQGKDLILISD